MVRYIKESQEPFKRLNPNGKYTTYSRSKYGVGKEMMGKYYVYKKYADRIVPIDILNKAKEILSEQFPSFEYNCVMYDPKDPMKVRFDESPDFFESPEPEVGEYIVVDTETEKTRKGVCHQIWHHKWMWVDPDDKEFTGFDVDDSYNWSKEWTQKISKPSGYRNKWNQSLADNDLIDGKY